MTTNVANMISDEFKKSGISPDRLEERNYPGEKLILIEVRGSQYSEAMQIAERLEKQLDKVIIAIRHSTSSPTARTAKPTSLGDSRVSQLIELLTARSRTSESQPSLEYVVDATQNIRIATSPRHTLVFGRRGVGKTALLLEARQLVSTEGAVSLWVNMQPLRLMNAKSAFLKVSEWLIDLLITHLEANKRIDSQELSSISSLRNEIILQQGQSNDTVLDNSVGRIVPELHRVLSRFVKVRMTTIFLFLDDIHYMAMRELPKFLDLVHSITRDSSVWIKAAGIKHQCRWFSDNPPTGLQTGHDATVVNLDVTLEEPSKAKSFLSKVLQPYARDSGLASLNSVWSGSAIDRLVLASGGVPRDFLILSAAAIQVTKRRPNARFVGVQDVNVAAGDAADIKIKELEEDASSSGGAKRDTAEGLNSIRDFLLNQKQCTFFRVSLGQKESHPKEYNVMQSLMDLRLIHLINSSLSDQHKAGLRYEVYMLDLSQFSGRRLKHNLLLLDFNRGHLVLKRTRSTMKAEKGDSPRNVSAILRKGPLFSLADLRISAAP